MKKTKWLAVPEPEDWNHDPEALREFLSERGLSHAAAGKLIGVHVRTMQKWTGGESQMRYSDWLALVHRSFKVGQ